MHTFASTSLALLRKERVLTLCQVTRLVLVINIIIVKRVQFKHNEPADDYLTTFSR